MIYKNKNNSFTISKKDLYRRNINLLLNQLVMKNIFQIFSINTLLFNLLCYICNYMKKDYATFTHVPYLVLE